MSNSGVTPPRTNPITHLEFSISSPAYPFLELSADTDCRLVLEALLPQAGDADHAVEFFTMSGADPEYVRDRATAIGIDEAHIVGSYNDHALLELTIAVTQPEECVALTLAASKAIPRHIEANAGDGEVVAVVPSTADPTTAVDTFLGAHPEAELTARQQRGVAGPLFTERMFSTVVRDRLTDRQLEVLQTAYEHGYFEQPRETSGQELADQLGISQTTFNQHLRAGLGKILFVLLEEHPSSSDDG